MRIKHNIQILEVIPFAKRRNDSEMVKNEHFHALDRKTTQLNPKQISALVLHPIFHRLTVVL